MKPVLGIHALVAFTLFALLAVCTPGAHAQTFSNSAAIIIPAVGSTTGASTPYPSSITVTGAPTSIGYVSVTLNGFSHSWVSDINVLLVSPTGQKILLMVGCNGSGDASNNTLTFIPDGMVTLPAATTNVVSGLYACTIYGTPSAFPAPAPAGPFATSLAPLIGTNANGTWSLYVVDDFASQDNGILAGGWSITFNEIAPQSPTTAFTYQGVLNANGSPLVGAANVRFILCNSAIAPTALASVAPSIVRSFTDIAAGRITTTLDFGGIIDTSQALWLNIEVESPPGSGFVTLTPRQPITPSPQARTAQRAVFADSATNATTATTATQLAPGRATIRGDAGASGNSPGIWFASPVASPSLRAFVGMRDDISLGFFNSNWNLLLYNNGNLAVGDPSGTAPPERLTVNGSIQVNTGTTTSPNRLAFGPVGNLAGTAEFTDAVFFQRFNANNNNTDLRLYIGDDPTTVPGLGGDTFTIWTSNGTPSSGTERFRFQSDGNAFKPGGGSWAVLSDPRAKHDIAPLAGTLDKLMSLRGYSFLYNDDRIASGLARPGTQFGLMADEVERVFPDWVSTDSTGTRYVTERATTALMVEALRDLRAEKDRQIEALKAEAAKRDAEAARRDAENAELKARIERLERALNKP